MGLLSELLLLPLAPARLAWWAIDRVVDVASQQYNDPTAVRRELAELNRQLDAGSISEVDFDRREDELLDRLYAKSNTDGGPS
jgi:Gas vesicle protein G